MFASGELVRGLNFMATELHKMLALAEPGAFRFGGGGFLGLLLPMRLFPQDKQPGPTRTTFSLIDTPIFS